MSQQPSRNPAQPILQHFGLFFWDTGSFKALDAHPRALRIPCFTPGEAGKHPRLSPTKSPLSQMLFKAFHSYCAVGERRKEFGEELTSFVWY